MNIRTIAYKSAEYEDFIALRNEVLRKPIGLILTEEDIRKEPDDLFIVCMEDQALIGCCILTESSHSEAKLRQMAVKKEFQGKGIGEKLLAFAEQISREKGYLSIHLHARKTAVDFYKKYGYTTVGEEFTEVGIPHFAMKKTIN